MTPDQLRALGVCPRCGTASFRPFGRDYVRCFRCHFAFAKKGLRQGIYGQRPSQGTGTSTIVMLVDADPNPGRYPDDDPRTIARWSKMLPQAEMKA